MRNLPRMITTHNGVPERIIHHSPCSIMEKCGGCGLIDLTYKNQLLEKTAALKTHLKEIVTESHSIFIKDCVGNEENLGYRTSVKIIVSEKLAQGKRWINLGFYRQSLNEVVDIGRCPTLSNTLNDILAWLRSGIKLNDVTIHSPRNKNGLLQSITLRSSKHTKQVLLILTVSHENLPALRPFARQISQKFTNIQGVFAESPQGINLLCGQDGVEEKYGDFLFKFSAASQIPANPFSMHKTLLRIKELADLSGKETVVTLSYEFAGIPLFFAKLAQKIIAIGSSRQCAEDGRKNAVSNRIRNIEFYEGKPEENLNKLRAEKILCNADVMMISTQRGGLGMETIENISALNPSSVIYHSAYTDAFLADLKKLLAVGFKAVFVEQYDSLPGTVHYDVLCYLKK